MLKIFLGKVIVSLRYLSIPSVFLSGVKRSRRISTYVSLIMIPAILSACTDYAAKMEDDLEEWKASQHPSYEKEPVPTEVVDPSTVIMDEVTDLRDGQIYKTVAIGSQIWMAQNLNYEMVNSFCYNDDSVNCSKYGRLYLWSTAMDSAGIWTTNGKGCGYGMTCTPTYPVRGVCPEGWHLPTQTEWNTLFIKVGGSSTAGKMLKSTNGWYSSGNGIDAYAFSALPSCYRSNHGAYYYEGYYAFFWSSTEIDDNHAYYMYLYHGNVNAILNHYNDKNYAFSVRCLKN